jgi:hypothetical protein
MQGVFALSTTTTKDVMRDYYVRRKEGTDEKLLSATKNNIEKYPSDHCLAPDLLTVTVHMMDSPRTR